jgi:neutral ceramidase
MKETVMSIAMMAVLGSSILCGAGDGWMAGTAQVEITPEHAMWMAGYASRREASKGTMHPLWVKALALQDGKGHQTLMITSDILGFPKDLSDRVRDRLRASLKLERDQIILNASHTHSGPVVGDSLLCIYPLEAADLEKVQKYELQLEEKVVAVARQAFEKLKPARLSSGNGQARFAVNRRNNSEGKVPEMQEFRGPVDHAVPVLQVTDDDGKALAVLFGYACHCTTLAAQKWNGDYAGFAQIELEKALPGCTAMFFAGCGGNQNPIPRRTVALAKQYGKTLAAAVEAVMEGPMDTLDATMTTAYQEPDLLLSTAPTREDFVKITEGGADYMRRAAEGMIAELDAGRALRTTYPYPITVWRLGDLPIVALGGEVVVDYAIFIKQMLGYKTFVMGYSNDVMSYIPSEIVLEEGGYEGDTSQLIYGMPSKWKPGIEKHILATVGGMAKELGINIQEAK